ncbi:uncharacterized protein EAF01_002991 [Botrytis porri]|uniref:uncharacterized protein n=1 Tax=Botrytis porri TaxID=87229 RepID=UPI0019019817|nr:uncharacterized protein EAF01_002991 [Botrytis porri]KAF7911484.1 hypothetical protein EAF01_002991 [Botrytis porri]
MHSSIIAAFVCLLAFGQSVRACTRSEDCCWGGSDGGESGCNGQHSGWPWANPCHRDSYKADFCKNNGVSHYLCDADCCTISTQKGRPCP